MRSIDIKNMLPNFEENENLLSDFIRDLTIAQLEENLRKKLKIEKGPSRIPKKLIQYWHDFQNIPKDVKDCLNSWERLKNQGFEIIMFDDILASKYISQKYGYRESTAFSHCEHPAMRCDYLRMCVLLAEGGLYVDADDVLLSDNWMYLFDDSRLKIQPLCYDISINGMIPQGQIWQKELPRDNRIFYINNDPIAAPANHPIIYQALTNATKKLLTPNIKHEIQSTTGPGNLTIALANHAYYLKTKNLPYDFEILHNWDAIAETRWELSYRDDDRNWRNVF